MIGLGMSAGKNILLVEHVQVVALYDPNSGRIKHLHMVTTLSGATPLTQEEAIAEAKRRASRHIPNIDDLAVALSNDMEHGHRPHYIDLNTMAFIPLPDEK
jgi:flavin-binding protein dodecin